LSSAPVVGSRRRTARVGPLTAHTASAPKATPFSGAPAATAVTRRVFASMRVSSEDPSVIHTPPAPIAIEVASAAWAGAGPSRKRIGAEIAE
jgi:hypothetical protein